MKRLLQKLNRTKVSWFCLFFGLISTVVCLRTLPGDGRYRGFPVPSWGVAIQALISVCIVFISLRGILRGEGEKYEVTDEDVEKSKHILEQMYLQEHGELPDKIPADTKDPKNL